VDNKQILCSLVAVYKLSGKQVEYTRKLCLFFENLRLLVDFEKQCV